MSSLELFDWIFKGFGHDTNELLVKSSVGDMKFLMDYLPVN
jgi:hypothetical protein